MKSRFAIIALTMLAAGTAVAAEPPKANAQPPKHRTARVTTCRCGDQTAEEQPEQ